jgi:mono/diheme cytochrome c family protein
VVPQPPGLATQIQAGLRRGMVFFSYARWIICCRRIMNMQIKFAIVAAWGLAVFAAAAVIPQDVTRNASDGVFTVEQAKRGQTAFGTNCAICHGDAMDGSESGPSLSGDEFKFAWQGHNAGEIVDRIQKTMPPDHPGTLSREQATDIATYILSFNKYPAGTTEMPSSADLLKQIRIDAVKAGK